MNINANQIFYGLILFFTLGISFNAYLNFNKYSLDKKMNSYWVWSLIFLQASQVLAVIIPFGFNLLAIPFNTFIITSLAYLGLLIRSWNTPILISTKILSHLYIAIHLLCYAYAYLYHGFLERAAITSSAVLIALLWQFYELIKLIKKNNSIHLKFIIGLISFSIVIVSIRLLVALKNHSPDEKATFFYNESQHTQLIRFIFSCSILLIYVFISNYFYQTLLDNEKKALKKIKDQDKKLNLTTKAKNNLSNILKERELVMAKLLASNKISSTSALSATIAHELNQPLGAMRLNSEHLEMRLNKEISDKPELKTLIRNILADNQRAASIVKTLRNMFIDKNTEYKETNTSQLIEKLKVILIPIAQKYQINLIFKLNSSASIIINENEFTQVILNLFNNAIDATQSIKRKKEIVISTQDKKKKVIISISDNGIGVDKKIKRNLFDLLKTNKEGGSGIGLWLAKYVIEKSKGSISFKNLPKYGVVFTIELPAIPKSKI